MITSLFKAFTMLGSEWVMWIMMLLSVISLAVIFERFRALRSQENLGARFWREQMDSLVASGSVASLKQKSEELKASYPCVETELLSVLVKQEKAKDLTLITQGFLTKQKLEMEKNLAFLGTVGSNAPFIGLFGTVLGIIKAFHDLSGKVESGSAQTISSGISEALVATAIGLLVAIPAVIFFNYFQRKIKAMIGRAESLANLINGS